MTSKLLKTYIFIEKALEQHFSLANKVQKSLKLIFYRTADNDSLQFHKDQLFDI